MMTPAQLEERRKRINATDIPAILGFDEYRSAIDVAQEKWGEAKPREEELIQTLGNLMEEPIIQLYEKRTGSVVTRNRESIQHPHSKLIWATPDGLRADRIVDSKNLAHGDHGDLGDEGTDEVKDRWNIQMQVGMACTGRALCDIPVLISGREFKIFTIKADHELQGQLIEVGEKFWRDYVLPHKLPPVDGSKGYSSYLQAKFPEQRKPILEATPEAEKLALELIDVRSQIEKLEEQEALRKNQLKLLIEDADGIRGSMFKILWRAAKGSVKTDWEAIVKALNPPEQLVQAHTRITQGSRRFIISSTGSK